jgi:hypothetical protein
MMRAPLSFSIAALTILAAAPGCDSTSGRVGPSDPKPELIVTPTSASIELGGRLQLNLIARDENGQTTTATGVAWETLDPKVAGVGGDGVVTGHEAGATRVRAWWNGVSGSSIITVTPGHESCAPPPDGPKDLLLKPACVAH